uniref:methylenetetrahydrofolate reductase (NADH) n=1 Tax=Chromera velia CCMP2878 TaxID=1169474 RepID=A0A0G4FJW1_9ALVE|mmetsp:Transcript_46228/g.91168  ORF Transcript_46228/g.91168 Transcript_46228/m.91168 type:complete len:607 (+) Transcript_46228:194-2014(+)|eukprot:Cvel_17427.t1-p1 / transcript=Cvel_17427.t1 / gene=Cvel_17427 / organism=Chromera_velia_CCMP2878 / gene_product=Methylenetetrahydrofolate reductase 1, putative / transcript_product=Methylenetetrahydrofolate reductase 1, putative / location=Cvel_scaffold1389:23008-28832(+) / protein_length=606 / sequence_SO=supercontig / SO=protein_coding / is_pseudo=false
MRVDQKIREWQEQNPGRYFFSFEYFPPKTETGTLNLYDRLDRMGMLNPMWIDITWGAGGSTADKTMDICLNAVRYHGLEPMMHLTCTNMKKEMIDEALEKCKENGIQNVLALRGDPPHNQERWTAVEGGFQYASDLVAYIREKHGEYFCIAVAGYPEGHLENESRDDDLKNLKYKVDMGANFIVTQLFYDNDEFMAFVKRARDIGIECPIIPGIMPIQNYAGFKRMTTLCKTKVPPAVLEDLETIKDDDGAVKDFGVKLCIQMCKRLMKEGVCPGLHFYTLNLEVSVMRIVDGLELVADHVSSRALPWKRSVHPSRDKEEVRPIFWANRPKSYIKRTMEWDDFPNGRWGKIDSPAYGDGFVSASQNPDETSMSHRRKMWGEDLASFDDVFRVFTCFIKNDPTVPRIPWCPDAPAEETNFLKKQLVAMNKKGLLTINSQPRVNGALSSDPYFGWGPHKGFVYQKAYAEFFCSPGMLTRLISAAEAGRLGTNVTYTAVNRQGKVQTNCAEDSVNAVTWGVFPNSEIKQPTVVDYASFVIWKDEAFSLWVDEWGCLYPDDSKSRQIIEEIANNWWLVNIVDNDFVSGDLFNHLTEEVSDPIKHKCSFNW